MGDGLDVTIRVMRDRDLAAVQQLWRDAALVEHDNEPSSAFFRRVDYRTDVPIHYFRKLHRPDV
jgi:hypothetical protein